MEYLRRCQYPGRFLNCLLRNPYSMFFFIGNGIFFFLEALRVFIFLFLLLVGSFAF